MGVGYYRAITQWSSGEYVGANQTQDDFAVMHANGAVSLADDYPESAPPPLAASSPRAGIISTRADVDVFTITLTQPTTITVSTVPAPTSPNLDVALTLRNPAGQTIAAADPPSGSTSDDRHRLECDHHDRPSAGHLHGADRRRWLRQPAQQRVLRLRQPRHVHAVTRHDLTHPPLMPADHAIKGWRPPPSAR